MSKKVFNVKVDKKKDFSYTTETLFWCRRPESNRYDRWGSQDFKSCASACSATPATLEAAPRFELGVKDLQSSALPLGYAAKDGAEDGIWTRDIRLGKATLYHWATPAYFVFF